MTFQVGNAAYPSASEIRDQILRDLDYYGRQHGIVFNVRAGSEHFLTATALANRVVVAIANNRISHDQRNPLTATGTGLHDLARVYGIEKRPATTSSGPATVKMGAGQTATIPAGWQATAPNGKKYRTTAEVFSASNGSQVVFLSVDSGADTELVVGTQLTWDSAAIAALLNPATVVAPGVRGGADTDDDEDIRRRLVDRLAAQAVGGNSASIKGWAEEVSPSISLAVVYQAVRGPGSLDAAVVRDRGDRTVVGTTVDLARANLNAELPGGVISVNCTTVSPQNLDIVVEAVLPLPRSAGGTGGGWRDATPWPAELAKVTNIVGVTYTVDSTAAPIVGQTIGLWDYSDPDEPAMRERTVATIGGSPGAWDLTFAGGGTAFVGVGDYVSAGATNLVAYTADLYAQFLLLGPGEKTDNPDLLPRSARYPSPEVTAQFSITNKQIGEVLAKYDEMLDLVYLATYESGTVTTRTVPSLPPTTASAPRILVCRRLAFVRKT